MSRRRLSMRELAQGRRLTCRSGENLSDDARAKQRGWRSEETQHTVELICNNRAPVGRLVDAAQVPLKRPDVVRALVLQLRKTIILHLHTVPGNINGRLDGPEPASFKARTKASLRLLHDSVLAPELARALPKCSSAFQSPSWFILRCRIYRWTEGTVRAERR